MPGMHIIVHMNGLHTIAHTIQNINKTQIRNKKSFMVQKKGIYCNINRLKAGQLIIYRKTFLE